MYLLLWLLLLPEPSNQECSLKFDFKNLCFHCTNTSFEFFLYDFHGKIKNFEYKTYSLAITDSKFSKIYSFRPPLPSKYSLEKFALTSSSVEFIEDGAFEEFIDIVELILSKNKLSDINFVKSLPKKIRVLILDYNNFEIINDVFNNLPFLSRIDLSNCKISKIDSDSFANFRNHLDLRLSNNFLSLFKVNFLFRLTLALDLSRNNLTHFDNYTTFVNFQNLNLSHNRLEKINDLGCQYCEYIFYKTTIQFVDLSFNDLSNVNLASTFDGVKLQNLILSNSNINSESNLEIVTYPKNIADLSHNKLQQIKSQIFGISVKLSKLILFNSSISSVSKNGFSSLKVEVLNISSNFITELKDFTFQNSEIQILDLSKNRIKTIQSKTFSNLNLSKTLDLNHNQISYLNEKVFESLTKVKTVDLSFNPLKKLNKLFSKNWDLKILILSNTKMEVIKRGAFDGINKLSELHLKNNFLEEINFESVNIDGLLNLQKNSFKNFNFSFLGNSSVSNVLLSGNNFETLENTIVVNTTTQNIDLSNSKICKIKVDAFHGLNNLNFLNLSNNCLEAILPHTFLSLRKLSTLDLTKNKIAVFSKDAFPFGNRLQNLSLTFFQTNITSDTFVALNSLKVLSVEHSIIDYLEKNCFRGLINLKILNLVDVEVNNIVPGTFIGLSNLERSDFRMLFKNIKLIKSGTFEGLINLEFLNLTDLNISSLQSEAFLGLDKLINLTLSDNKLKQIINCTFLGLESLQFLNLSNNIISTLDSEAFQGLTQLSELHLNNNNLTKLVLGTFQNFPFLKILNLRKNNINKLLTGTFSNLKNLKHLDLALNNITKLKMENLMPLTALETLDLSSNHLIQMSHLDLIKSLRNLEFVKINDNKWKCDNLSKMLIAFQNYSIDWVSTRAMTFTHENIDGIKCYDICKFFYCVEEEESLYGA